MASPSILPQSRNTFKQNKGFTLVEILIAIGILAIIFGLGLFVSFDFYKSYAFHAEKNIIISTLQRARNQSLNNINQVRHGVHFEPSPLRYILFECPLASPQCSDYAPSSLDVVVESSWGISFIDPPTPPLPFDIIFDQLNGDCIDTGSACNPITTIRISDGTKSYDIIINQEGRIDW